MSVSITGLPEMKWSLGPNTNVTAAWPAGIVTLVGTNRLVPVDVVISTVSGAEMLPLRVSVAVNELVRADSEMLGRERFSSSENGTTIAWVEIAELLAVFNSKKLAAAFAFTTSHRFP